MTIKENKFECYFLLYLSHQSEKNIKKFLLEKMKINEEHIQRGMHLTVYYGRRKLPIDVEQTFLSIESDTSESRFMVFAPGGENPRPNLKPSLRSVGIRLTKRNIAIPHILKLRRNIYKYESNYIKRSNTTDWKSAFGSRHYQPHIKLLKPGTLINDDLTLIGNEFRNSIKKIEFSKFVQKQWIR